MDVSESLDAGVVLDLRGSNEEKASNTSRRVDCDNNIQISECPYEQHEQFERRARRRTEEFFFFKSPNLGRVHFLSCMDLLFALILNATACTYVYYYFYAIFIRDRRDLYQPYNALVANVVRHLLKHSQ